MGVSPCVGDSSGETGLEVVAFEPDALTGSTSGPIPDSGMGLTAVPLDLTRFDEDASLPEWDRERCFFPLRCLLPELLDEERARFSFSLFLFLCLAELWCFLGSLGDRLLDTAGECLCELPRDRWGVGERDGVDPRLDTDSLRPRCVLRLLLFSLLSRSLRETHWRHKRINQVL